jgi:hypothetical protein
MFNQASAFWFNGFTEVFIDFSVAGKRISGAGYRNTGRVHQITAPVDENTTLVG